MNQIRHKLQTHFRYPIFLSSLVTEKQVFSWVHSRKKLYFPDALSAGRLYDLFLANEI